MKEIQGFPIPQKNYYKVYVNTITYNQSQYIEDCLNGVAKQTTTFPFVHHVIDDASIDGEQEVIKAWMMRECNMDKAEYYDNDICNIILAPNKNNINCTVAAYLLKKNLYREPKKKEALYKPWRDVCPYEALCEGDDYWIDSKKLQKQVDFMESNPMCSLYFCNAKVQNVNNLPCSMEHGKIEDREYNASEVFKSWCVPTASVIFKKEILDIELRSPERFMFGDIAVILRAERFGKVFGSSETMVVYRINHGGVTQDSLHLESFIRRRPQHIECIIDNFGDIMDIDYLKNDLCLSYCNKAVITHPLGEKISDYLHAFMAKKKIAMNFIIHVTILNNIKSILKRMFQIFFR